MKRNNKAGWAVVDGKRFYFRSKMEFKFALYLVFLQQCGHIARWEHESKTFWFNAAGAKLKRGTMSYKPDFVAYTIYDKETSAIWYEVKGYMDTKSKTKIKRFRKYFPQENLVVIDAPWFKRNKALLDGLVKKYAK